MIEPTDPHRGEKIVLLARMGILAYHMCVQYPEVAEKIKARTVTHLPTNKDEEEESATFIKGIYRGT